MDRTAYNALLAQYRVRELTGDGVVNWDGGVHCVIPEVKLYGKCGQDGTPTPESPVEIKCNNGTFAVRGRNLFPTFQTETKNGVTLTPRPDGGFELDGTCTASVNFAANISLPAGEYTLACGRTGVFPYNGNALVQVYKADVILLVIHNNGTAQTTYSGVQAVAADDIAYRIRADGGHTYDHCVIYPLLVGGTYTAETMPPYAPYFDGGTAQAPDLYGIPGTEYRDEWDAQTGQGVRRCAIIERYAGETITTPYISSTGELSDGATVIYGIPDTPFYATPARLTMPPGAGQIIQTGGDVADCPLAVRWLGHQ